METRGPLGGVLIRCCPCNHAYPEAPQQFLFGVHIKNPMSESPKGLLWSLWVATPFAGNWASRVSAIPTSSCRHSPDSIINLYTRATRSCQSGASVVCNTGASIIRIGFWGPLYYNCNKEPSKLIVQVIIKAPILNPQQMSTLLSDDSPSRHAMQRTYVRVMQ